jgi:hypothetical protein
MEKPMSKMTKTHFHVRQNRPIFCVLKPHPHLKLLTPDPCVLLLLLVVTKSLLRFSLPGPNVIEHFTAVINERS